MVWQPSDNDKTASSEFSGAGGRSKLRLVSQSGRVGYLKVGKHERIALIFLGPATQSKTATTLWLRAIGLLEQSIVDIHRDRIALQRDADRIDGARSLFEAGGRLPGYRGQISAVLNANEPNRSIRRVIQLVIVLPIHLPEDDGRDRSRR